MKGPTAQPPPGQTCPRLATLEGAGSGLGPFQRSSPVGLLAGPRTYPLCKEPQRKALSRRWEGCGVRGGCGGLRWLHPHAAGPRPWLPGLSVTRALLVLAEVVLEGIG